MKYVYKIVAALCAIAIIVIAICTPILSISIESFLPAGLLTIGALLKNDSALELLEKYDGAMPSTVGEKISVLNLISPNANSIAETLSNLSSEESAEATMEALKPILPALIVFVVVFALILIFAIAIIITAFASKNNRNVIYLSVAGCGLTLMLFESFEGVAAPFLSEQITLADIAGSEWISLIGSISGLELTSTLWLIPLVFVCIIIWTVLYNATLPEKEKIERKKMLGEFDEI
ncbi:MAG: hypothetical protein IJ025_07705 [Clostridia bacterium]|nr:hypothetical protein [Clostridia bacterium]